MDRRRTLAGGLSGRLRDRVETSLRALPVLSHPRLSGRAIRRRGSTEMPAHLEGFERSYIVASGAQPSRSAALQGNWFS
jgi:hypothetical protein